MNIDGAIVHRMKLPPNLLVPVTNHGCIPGGDGGGRRNEGVDGGSGGRENIDDGQGREEELMGVDVTVIQQNVEHGHDEGCITVGVHNEGVDGRFGGRESSGDWEAGRAEVMSAVDGIIDNMNVDHGDGDGSDGFCEGLIERMDGGSGGRVNIDDGGERMAEANKSVFETPGEQDVGGGEFTLRDQRRGGGRTIDEHNRGD